MRAEGRVVCVVYSAAPGTENSALGPHPSALFFLPRPWSAPHPQHPAARMFLEGALGFAPLLLGAAQRFGEAGVAAEGVDPGVAHEEGEAVEAVLLRADGGLDGEGDLADVGDGPRGVVEALGRGA